MRRQWSFGLVTAAALATGGVALSGCGATPSGKAAAHATSTAQVGALTTSAAPSRTPTPTPTPTRPAALPLAPAGDGSRPQTQAVPKTDNAAFRNLVADLWLSVATGNPSYARPAFFPEAAYKQVKAIADPSGDWQNRLWYDFRVDVAAAHQLVGDDAQLVKVVVPTQFAQWIPVGACYNSDGYWHLPGARVEYREGGQLKSFGIASMISWRGVWYVIHFGGVDRPGVGMVDQPADGEGIPGPPGSC